MKKNTRTENNKSIFVINKKRLHKLFSNLKQKGVKKTFQYYIERFKSRKKLDYNEWVKSFAQLTENDKAKIYEHIKTFGYKPVISIIMPIYNTPEIYLKKAIDSVRAQLYENWELCIADDNSSEPHVRVILEHYMKIDERIKVVFRENNGHISEASNSALHLTIGEYVGLLDHDDELLEHALYMNVEALNKNPRLDLIYSDEDKLDQNEKCMDGFFKPDWNPLLLLSMNYTCHFSVYRASILKRIGGFRKGYEGSQDYDLVLRFTEQIPAHNIYHIPHVLYHWRAIEGSTALNLDSKSYAVSAARQAIESHLERMKVKAKVIPHPMTGSHHRVIFELPNSLPKVGIIIPTKDKVDLLRRAIASILMHKNEYPNFEIIVMNNNSEKKETFAYLQAIKQYPQIKVIDCLEPFNWSRINNLGAKVTDAELLCFLNNDIEVITPDWLKEMVGILQYPKIAAVGAKLYYPDNTVQHAGVVLGMNHLAAHIFRTDERFSFGYFARLIVLQNYSAVTGACLLVKRQIFDKLGGFDEALAVTYNDVEFCVRLNKAGYLIAWTPFAELYHYESATRTSDLAPENIKRFEKESSYIRTKHTDILNEDPAYNPNLDLFSMKVIPACPPRAIKPWLENRVSISE